MTRSITAIRRSRLETLTRRLRYLESLAWVDSWDLSEASALRWILWIVTDAEERKALKLEEPPR